MALRGVSGRGDRSSHHVDHLRPAHLLCGHLRMTPGARISAAIEVLADIEARRRPAADALKDWGLAHRFAGSKDRAAIASLVYDALRRRASAAWLMDDASPRAVVAGMLRLQRSMTPEDIEKPFSGERHAPPPLSEAERECL